jgi:hypothetical protein
LLPPLKLWSRPSIAPGGASAPEKFRVIHPFHPLFGREFEHLSYRCNWGEDRVRYIDDEGRMCTIPALWTSIAPSDPFVIVAAGRSLFRYEDLLKLAALLEGLQS